MIVQAGIGPGLSLPGSPLFDPSPFLLDFRGRWVVDHTDRHGRFKGRYDIPNGITNQGKNYIMNAGFASGAIIALGSWFLGLIDGTGTPTLAPGDVMGGHSGWNEFSSYAGNRPAWGQATSTAQSLTNATPASYTISAAGTLFGLFIVSVNTGGTGSDILWSTAAFTLPVPVAIADLMKASYTLAT
jgi:hypothetical protein